MATSMADHLRMDELTSNADFDFVDDASYILGADQGDFKLVKFEISFLLDLVSDAFEELDFVVSRLVSVGEARMVACSLELNRII